MKTASSPYSSWKWKSSHPHTTSSSAAATSNAANAMSACPARRTKTPANGWRFAGDASDASSAAWAPENIPARAPVPLDVLVQCERVRHVDDRQA